MAATYAAEPFSPVAAVAVVAGVDGDADDRPAWRSLRATTARPPCSRRCRAARSSTGSLPFRPAGATISTGTRSTVPSAFFSLANDHREIRRSARWRCPTSSLTSAGTFGRSSSLRNAAFAFSGGCWAAAGGREGHRDEEREEQTDAHDEAPSAEPDDTAGKRESPRLAWAFRVSVWASDWLRLLRHRGRDRGRGSQPAA